MLNVQKDIDKFLRHLNARVKLDESKRSYDPESRYFVDGKGRKYHKVVRGDKSGSRSVVMFVDQTTGDIYKPASWAAPAKHSRGNIEKPYDAGHYSDTLYFVNYL